MKKRLALILSGAMAAGVLSLALPAAFAQATNQQLPPPTGIPPTPGTPGIPDSPQAPQALPGRPALPQFGGRPGALPPRRMPANFAIRRTVSQLEAAKRELTASPTDFDGHRQAALDACDKAIQELNELLKHVPPPPSPVANPAATNVPPVAPPAPK